MSSNISDEEFNEFMDRIFSFPKETRGLRLVNECDEPVRIPRRPVGSAYGYKSEIIRGVMALYIQGVPLVEISAYFDCIPMEDLDAIITAYSESCDIGEV